MPINLKQPIIKPASEEKVFDSVWVSILNVNAQSQTRGRVNINLTPLNSKTGELDKNNRMFLHGDLWDIMQNVPEAAAAMQAVFDAIPAIQDYLNTQP